MNLPSPKRLRSLFAALLGLCLSAMAAPAQQAPTTHNIMFSAMQTAGDGEMRHRIWAYVYIETSQLPPAPPGPPPPPDKPPVTKPRTPTPVPEWHDPIDPYPFDPDDPNDPPPGGGGNGPGGGCGADLTLQYHELYRFDYKDYSPIGLFSSRSITASTAVARGASQAEVDAILNAPGLVRAIFMESCESQDAYTGSTQYPASRTYASIHPRRGAVELNVDVPADAGGAWRIDVTDALAYIRRQQLALAPGPHKITITSINAGNVLVALYAVDANGARTGHFQEAYALVRKGETYTIDMEFVEDGNAPDRYRIGHLALGQNSQSVLENLPLQAGRDAMVRIMAYDAWGDSGSAGGWANIDVAYSLPDENGDPVLHQLPTFLSVLNGRHVDSGRKEAYWGIGLGPIIPAEHVKPGLKVKATLYRPNSTEEACQTDWLPVEVLWPRRIYIKRYEVKYLWGSGAPIVRNETVRWEEEIMPFARSAFPYAEFEHEYKGSINLPPKEFFKGLEFASLGAIPEDILGWTVALMNAKADFCNTDDWVDGRAYLYLGVSNYRYRPRYAAGMCFYWMPGIALSACHGFHNERVAYNLVHEMGHAFGVEHAPSEGAGQYLGPFHTNVVDHDYPYSGGGMAGGWGYIDTQFKLKGKDTFQSARHFHSEDAHTSRHYFWAHWDVMAYAKDIPTASDLETHRYKYNRFSDYNQRKLLDALKPWEVPEPAAGHPGSGGGPGQGGPPSPIEAYCETLPGTDTLIFGAAAAHAVEEAWFQLHGLRSIHAIDPMEIESAPLDVDISWLIVTDEGKIIFAPPEMPEGDGGGHLEFPPGGPDDGDMDDDEWFEEDEGEGDDAPPYMIVLRLPRLLGVNVDE